MKVLNFGSLNIDYVYSVDHIVAPGETIASQDLALFCGGKGLNQSVALSRAGLTPYHAGMVGADGGMLLELCRESGIDTSLIRQSSLRSGNAIIQVAKSGQNSIVLFGGANRQLTEEYIREVIGRFAAGDLLLLQNEVNLLHRIIDIAYERGMRIALNPSPFDDAISSCDFAKVSLLFINEVEGEQITGHSDPEAMLDKLAGLYPGMEIVLTLGKRGVAWRCGNKTAAHGIFPVQVVDTTAAGDTFTGYFISGLVKNLPVEENLRFASAASSLTVSRMGASRSIPLPGEVREMLARQA